MEPATWSACWVTRRRSRFLRGSASACISGLRRGRPVLLLLRFPILLLWTSPQASARRPHSRAVSRERCHLLRSPESHAQTHEQRRAKLVSECTRREPRRHGGCPHVSPATHVVCG